MVENQLNESALTETNNSVLERNRALLQYTATIANSNSNSDAFNYEFVQSLISGGADVNNAADQYEQSIFHEVARSWHVDVARFLLDNGKLATNVKPSFSLILIKEQISCSSNFSLSN